MTSYTVRVEWTLTSDAEHTGAASDPDPDRNVVTGDILDQLIDHHPAISPGRVLASGYVLPWMATITVDATTPRGAATKAVGAVESATGVPATGFEVLTTTEHDHRLEQPLMPDLVGNADIAEMLGVSRQRVTQIAHLDGFPPSVLDTRNGPFRVRQHVEAWARAWERKSGRPTTRS